MNKISVPFLATKEEQIAFHLGNHCVEGVIFNREDLNHDSWNTVWSNLKKAVNFFNPDNVTFHFPVNNADYTSDFWIKSKLQEAFVRATDMGLHGVIVHSNRIRPISKWSEVDLDVDRNRVVECLNNIRNFVRGTTWIALENMPVMDNYAKETDPLFSYPKDFKLLEDLDIGIVWDICHYSNTVATVLDVLSGQTQNKEHYPNLQKTGYLEFEKLSSKIVHWHFGGFLGIPNPTTGSHCKEGCLSYESSIEEKIYLDMMHLMMRVKSDNHHCVLEIQEKDYYTRQNTKKTIKWLIEKVNYV